MVDAAVIGASVAGSAVAIGLGRAGMRTLLVDKAEFPRPKPCGEGLLPHGVEALRALGLPEPPGTRVAGIRYHAPSGASAEARFDDAGLGHGLVVRREEFDAWLLGHARATPNVEVRTGFEARPDIDAPVVVGADGLRSMFHGRGRFVRTHPRRERAGVSTHVRGVRVDEFVDVYLADGGEAYVGPCGKGEASLAVLLERGVSFDEFVARVPALRGMEVVTRKLGAAPLGSRVSPLVDGRVLLVGDAAGAPDPVTGEGMSLALQSAAAACAAIRSGDLASYERERRRLEAPSARMGRLILWASRWFAERAVRRLARDPSLFHRLLRHLCGREELGVLEPARLLL